MMAAIRTRIEQPPPAIALTAFALTGFANFAFMDGHAKSAGWGQLKVENWFQVPCVVFFTAGACGPCRFGSFRVGVSRRIWILVALGLSQAANAGKQNDNDSERARQSQGSFHISRPLGTTSVFS
jgi:prepilin-type processing-associated H-X9-DG protein